MITLSDLRALLKRALTHAENPAIVRLNERTVEGVARAYLPRRLEAIQGRDADWIGTSYALVSTRALGRPLHLPDPGTAHAVVVVLALARGYDPGEGGLDVRWSRMGGAWSLCADRWLVFGPAKTRADDDDGFEDELPGVLFLPVPLVALEPDPLKALALAVRHVLETP